MKTRNLFWQLPLLLLLLMPFWREPVAGFLAVEQRAVVDSARQKSSFVMDGVRLSQTKKGREEMRLSARRLRSNDDQTVLYLEETETDLFDKAGEVIHLKGGSAVYEVNREILTVLDDVVLITGKMVMTTTVMRYLVRFGRVKSAAPVELLGDGMNITGTSFMYDLNGGVLRVGSRVRCRFW